MNMLHITRSGNFVAQKNSITGTILIRTITLCVGLHQAYR